MQPINLEKTKKIISPARLSSYVSFFQSKTDEELYGVYCWNLQLSSCFYDLISVVEVTLRNRVHNALSNYFSPGSESLDWYNQMMLSSKTQDKILKITHVKRRRNWFPKRSMPSADDVVSRVTLGFWKNVLMTERKVDGGIIPWEDILPVIVRNRKPQYNSSDFWRRPRNRESLYARIELVNRIRNRICHFEPIWKQKELYEERLHSRQFTPTIIEAAPATPAEAIKRLRLLHSRSVELLYWLSKARAGDYLGSESCKRFYTACSETGLQAYKDARPHVEACIYDLQNLQQQIQEKRKIKVLDAGEPLGFFYPN